MFNLRNSIEQLAPRGDQVNLGEIGDLDSLISAIRRIAKQEEYVNTATQSILDIDNFIDVLKQEPAIPGKVIEAILYLEKSTAASLFEKMGERGDSLTYRDIQDAFSGAITKQVTNALTGSSLNPSELFVITGHLETLSSLIKEIFSKLESNNPSFSPAELLENILSQLEETEKGEKKEALKMIQLDQMRVSKNFRQFFSEGLHRIITLCISPGNENCELITRNFNNDNDLFDAIIVASESDKSETSRRRMLKIKTILTNFTEYKDLTIYDMFHLLDISSENLSNEERHLYKGLSCFVNNAFGLPRSNRIKFGFLLALFNVEGMGLDLQSYVLQDDIIKYTRNNDGTVDVGNNPVET